MSTRLVRESLNEMNFERQSESFSKEDVLDICNVDEKMIVVN